MSIMPTKKEKPVTFHPYSKSEDLKKSLAIIGGDFKDVNVGDFQFDPSCAIAGLVKSERWWITKDTVIRLERRFEMLGGPLEVKKKLIERTEVTNKLSELMAKMDVSGLAKPEAGEFAMLKVKFRNLNRDLHGITIERFMRYLFLKDRVQNEPREVAMQAPNMTYASMLVVKNIVGSTQSIAVTPKMRQGPEEPPIFFGNEEDYDEEAVAKPPEGALD